MMPGHLIKVPESTTVYVIGDDFIRHVFPDEPTYYSWYRDFSAVETISDALMATVPLGRNMTRKPGIGFVKIKSDPKVYFVDVGAVLRWVPTEADAQSYFGPNWSKLVVDVPDTLFTDYTIGTPVGAAPAGTALTTSATNTTPVSELNLRSGGAPGTVQASLGDFLASVATLGSRDVTLGAFALTAPSDTAAVIKTLNFTGYIDAAEGDPDFQRGYDQDLTGATDFLSALVPSVRVVNAVTGDVLAGPTTMPSDGVLNFSNLSLRLEAGTSLKLAVRGDLSPTFDPGPNPDRVAFDLTGFTATKPDSTPLAVAGQSPNGGISPLQVTTIKRFGHAELSWVGGMGDLIAGHESPLGTLTVKAVDEPYSLTKLTFQTRGQSQSINSLRLAWTGPDGVQQSVSRPYQSAATFDNLAVRINQGASVDFQLYGTLYGQDKAKRDEEIVVDVNANAALSLTSLATGNVVDQTADGDHLKITSRPGDFLVRFTTLTARLDPTTPTTVPRTFGPDALRFTLTTGKDGPVRVRHLSFLVKPSDVDTQGPSNDLLERWADEVGNGNDASAIVVLRSSLDSYASRLAHDLPGRILYTIYRDDLRLEAPKGVNTIVNDAGIIEFTWNDDQAPVIPAGTTATFRLQLDASYFLTGGRTMTIEMLGGHDFEWLDTTTGYPGSTIDGTNVNGLPLQTGNLYVP